MGSSNAMNSANGLELFRGSWTPRKVVSATLVVLLVIFAFYLLVRFRLIVFGMFEAIVFSTAMRPAVDWMQRRGISRAVGAALIFFFILIALAGMIFLIVPLLAEQGQTIINTLLDYYGKFRNMLFSSDSTLLRRLAWEFPVSLQTLPSTNPDPNAVPLDQVAALLSSTGLIVRGIFLTISVLLLTFYWTIDRERILRSTLMLLPANRRDNLRELIDSVEDKVGAYLRGLGILCLSIGVLALIAYLIIGLPYAPFLAIVAGIMEAVPLLGPVLGALPAILIALALDPTKIPWIIGASVVIQMLENNLLVPRVMDRTVGVNPVVSLLAFVIFSSLFGLAGALLAVPLVAVLQMVFSRTILDQSAVQQTPPVGRDSISVLRYEASELIRDIRKQVRQKDTLLVEDPSDQIEDAIETIVNDLDSILAHAEQVDAPEKEPAT